MAPPTPGPITPSPSNPQPEKFKYLVNMIVPIPKSLSIPKVGSGETSNAYGIIESLDDTGANVIALGDKHHLTTETLDNLRKEYPVGSAPWMGPDIMWKVANMQNLKVSSNGPMTNGGILTLDSTSPELQGLEGYSSGTSVEWTGFRFTDSYLIKVENYLLWQLANNFEGYLSRPSELEEKYNFKFSEPFVPGGLGSVVGVPKGTKAYTVKEGSFEQTDYSVSDTLLGLVIDKNFQNTYSRVVVDGHNEYWFLNSDLDIPSDSNQSELTNKYGGILTANSRTKPHGVRANVSMLKSQGQLSPWYTNGSNAKKIYPNLNMKDDAIVFSLYEFEGGEPNKVGFLVLYDDKLLYAESTMS